MSFNLERIAEYCDHPDSLKEVYDAALEASKRLPDDYIFLETGTRAGGSALAIMQAVVDSGKNRWVFTVDPYGEKPYKIGKETTKILYYGEELYRTAMKVLADFALDNKVLYSHFRMKSLDWMTAFNNSEFWYNGSPLERKFGFAYLDGDHDPDTVSRELLWLQLHTQDVTVIADDAHYLNDSLTSKGIVRNDRLFIGENHGTYRG